MFDDVITVSNLISEPVHTIEDHLNRFFGGVDDGENFFMTGADEALIQKCRLNPFDESAPEFTAHKDNRERGDLVSLYKRERLESSSSVP